MTSTVDERAISEQLDAILASAVNEVQAEVARRVAEESERYAVSAERRTEIVHQAMRQRLRQAVNEARLVVGEAVFGKSKLQLEFRLVLGKEVASHPLMAAFMHKVADTYAQSQDALPPPDSRAKRLKRWLRRRRGNAYGNSSTLPGGAIKQGKACITRPRIPIPKAPGDTIGQEKVFIWVCRIGAVLMMIMTTALLLSLLHGIFHGEILEIRRFSFGSSLKKVFSRDLEPIMFWMTVCLHTGIAFFFAAGAYTFSRNAGWVRRIEKVEKTMTALDAVLPNRSSKVPPLVAVLVIGAFVMMLWVIWKIRNY